MNYLKMTLAGQFSCHIPFQWWDKCELISTIIYVALRLLSADCYVALCDYCLRLCFGSLAFQLNFVKYAMSFVCFKNVYSRKYGTGKIKIFRKNYFFYLSLWLCIYFHKSIKGDKRWYTFWWQSKFSRFLVFKNYGLSHQWERVGVLDSRLNHILFYVLANSSLHEVVRDFLQRRWNFFLSLYLWRKLEGSSLLDYTKLCNSSSYSGFVLLQVDPWM